MYMAGSCSLPADFLGCIPGKRSIIRAGGFGKNMPAIVFPQLRTDEEAQS